MWSLWVIVFACIMTICDDDWHLLLDLIPRPASCCCFCWTPTKSRIYAKVHFLLDVLGNTFYGLVKSKNASIFWFVTGCIYDKCLGSFHRFFNFFVKKYISKTVISRLHLKILVNKCLCAFFLTFGSLLGRLGKEHIF